MTTPSPASYLPSPASPPPPSAPSPFILALYLIISLTLFIGVLVAVLKLTEWHRRTRFREMWPDATLDDNGDIVADVQAISVPAQESAAKTD